MPKISVVICTWNRAPLLAQTLAGMRQLKIPAGCDWELLVVNNNCTDDTDEVIARYQSELPLRRLFAAEPGLANARNCAIREAQGELIVWTDDDVLVDADWIAAFVRAAEAWPDAAFFGGTVEPWFETSPPAWIAQYTHKLYGVYAIRQFGSEVRPLQGEELPYGANMALRTEIQRRYFYNANLGRVQNQLLNAEETEMFHRLQAEGHGGVWVGTARVRHLIPRERLTRKYVWEWHRGWGRSDMRRQELPEGRYWWGAPRWMLKKYWLFRLKMLAWRCVPGQRWVPDFLRTAYYQGMIEEVRRRSRLLRKTRDAAVSSVVSR